MWGDLPDAYPSTHLRRYTFDAYARSTKWLSNLRELAVATRMNSVSIFDLSASEKLQLVEDLWDYLAAAPGAVPLLRLAKAGIGTLSWKEVKRKVRARYAR